MDLVRDIVLFFAVMMAASGFCNASVYKVGDSAGWSISDNIDYDHWASSKSFLVGDTILFVYDPKYHNVLEVNRVDFHSCDTSAPISAYATGNDSIVIHGPGHYFYICGFVGHCQAGQKVDIRVPMFGGPTKIPISSPIQDSDQTAVPLSYSLGPMAPGPSPSRGGHSPMCCGRSLSFIVGLLLIVIWALI